MKTRPALRAVPLAVLLTLVLLSILGRTRKRPAVSLSGTADPPTLASGEIDASPFSRPLRSPEDGGETDADVPAGPPRTLHGGQRRTHRSRARGPRAANVGFRVSVDGPVAAQVTASPDGATLYVTTLGGQLVALARADGARRWSVPLGERSYATPLVLDDGTVVVGSDAKKLVALSPKGESLFKLDLDGEMDTGAVQAPDGLIVFAAGTNVFAARRAGDLAWRFAARRKVFTSPAVGPDGLVVFGSQDHHVYALSPAGTLAWKVDLGADVDGAPAIGDDGGIFVGTDAGEVVRLGATGTVVFRTQVGGFVRGALSVARNGDVLAGTYGPVPRVVRVAPSGEIRGAFAIRGTGAREFGIHGGPLEDADGVLYFGGQDDVVRAVGPDGVERWRFAARADVDAPLTLLEDGSLVVPSEDGTVTLLVP